MSMPILENKDLSPSALKNKDGHSPIHSRSSSPEATWGNREHSWEEVADAQLELATFRSTSRRFVADDKGIFLPTPLRHTPREEGIGYSEGSSNGIEDNDMKIKGLGHVPVTSNPKFQRGLIETQTAAPKSPRREATWDDVIDAAAQETGFKWKKRV